jgi:hypothetical protein
MIKHEENYIKKEDLIENEIYECDARNFTYGIWNGEAFEYIRHKFGMKYFFYDQEYHWDDGPPYGTVKPLKHITFD